MRHALLAAVLATLVLAACGAESEEGGTMLPSANCLASGCHGSGGEGPRFSAAGTVFAGGASTTGVKGAVVTIVSTGGATLELTTNSVGNFYTSAALTPPLTISVSHGGNANSMASTAPSGACGSCHKPAATGAAARARVHVGTCATCH